MCAPAQAVFILCSRKVANSPRTVRLSASMCLVDRRSVQTRRRRIRPCRGAPPTPPRTSKERNKFRLKIPDNTQLRRANLLLRQDLRRRMGVCLLLLLTHYWMEQQEGGQATSSTPSRKKGFDLRFFFKIYFVTKDKNKHN